MHNEILKKVVRKFFISLLTVTYAFLALTQATFAWIVLASEVQLEDAELSIITGSQFYVSVDGENFSTTLTNEMLSEVVKSNRLSDITSVDGVNFYKKEKNEKAKPNHHYISFPLWFRTQDKFITDLFLVGDNNSIDANKDNGTKVVSKGVDWISDLDFQYGSKFIKAGDKLVGKASDAIRIAIIEQDLDEEFGVEPKANLLSLIYDPSGNPDLGFGVETGAFEYYKLKKDRYVKVPEIFPDTKYSLSKIDNPYETDDDTSVCAKFQKIKLEDGTPWYYTKVLVNVWIEGWDADCFDQIAYDTVSIQLKFIGSSLTSK